MKEALYDEMFELEGTHWWFVARRRLVLSLLEQFLPASRRRSARGEVRIVDVGCGCGMMVSELREAGYDARGIDASDAALAYCRERGVPAAKGALPHELDLPRDSMDVVLMLDVIEHVADDRAAFSAALDLVRSGGLMVITAPAYPWLWTRRDEFHHHFRRYSRRSLKRVLTDDPRSRIVLLSYMNTLLFPAAAAARFLRRIVPLPDGVTDLALPPVPVNDLLKSVFASERFLLQRGISLPCGLSLLAVMRKL